MSASALLYEGRATKCFLKRIVHPVWRRQAEKSGRPDTI